MDSADLHTPSGGRTSPSAESPNYQSFQMKAAGSGVADCQQLTGELGIINA
jgi:hypothetical protein